MALPLSSLAVALVLDWKLGDPRGLPHPVCAIGRFIAWWDRCFRRLALSLPCRSVAELSLGALGCVVTVGLVALVFWSLERLALWIHPAFGWVFQTGLLFSGLAGGCLVAETKIVETRLTARCPSGARRHLAGLVGRDTADLTEADMVRASVETLAENLSDGVVAPLFWATVGAFWNMVLPLLWAYKAVNTMDSMIGYRNERYEYFGRTAARLDDLVNLIPARMTALALVVSAWLCMKRGRESWRILLRDKGAHSSPNAGWPESAVAGALGIQLGGSHNYGGVLVVKPTIGDDLRQPVASDISRAAALLWPSVGFCLLIFVPFLGRWFS